MVFYLIQIIFCVVTTIDLFTIAYLNAFGLRFLESYSYWENIADFVMLVTILITFFTAIDKIEDKNNSVNSSFERWEKNMNRWCKN